MNLKQLHYITRMVKNGFNVSKTAMDVHTTQPGVSTQIRLLEEELGTDIFVRCGKRLTGLTPAGDQIFHLAQETLQKVGAIKSVSKEFITDDHGMLSIATTHTQARYALPVIISQFVKKYPKVQLRIRQGNPTQISEMTLNGDVDIAIATEAIADYEKLVMLPVYEWNRCVIAKPDHPILTKRKLTLETISQYPIITYDFAFAGRSVINKAFEKAEISPNIVLTAIDSDVIKHYVEIGLGIGILAQMAFDPKKDKTLRSKSVAHLFEDSTTSIGIRKGHYLRSYMYHFIEMFAPHLSRKVVSEALGIR